MDLTPLIPAGRRIVEAYGDGGFRISGARHLGSVMVFADRVIEWPAREWTEIEARSALLALVAAPADSLELVLFGTGRRFQRLAPGLRQELRARGWAAEAMDTGAACRTYNVLMAEGRLVAAALIAVP